MTTPRTNPFGDIAAMMSQFKLPGLDMAPILEAQRKEIDALVAANNATVESMQAFASKQTEMLSAAMQSMQDAAKGFVASGGAADAGKQSEVVRKGFEQTLANMKELAEMARHAQSDAMTQITQRAHKQMQDLKALGTPK